MEQFTQFTYYETENAWAFKEISKKQHSLLVFAVNLANFLMFTVSVENIVKCLEDFS